MTDAPEHITEPAPAAEAPAVKARRRRGGGARRHFGSRPVDDPRNAWLTTRCTPAFLAKVQTDAKAAGLTLSDYMHVRLDGSPGPRARRNPGPDMKLLTQILAHGSRHSSVAEPPSL